LGLHRLFLLFFKNLLFIFSHYFLSISL
jgi:hypothetical protein